MKKHKTHKVKYRVRQKKQKKQKKERKEDLALLEKHSTTCYDMQHLQKFKIKSSFEPQNFSGKKKK